MHSGCNSCFTISMSNEQEMKWRYTTRSPSRSSDRRCPHRWPGVRCSEQARSGLLALRARSMRVLPAERGVRGDTDREEVSMRKLGAFLRSWPFLSLGLVTVGLFLAVEGFGERVGFLIPVVRILIMPLWLMRTLEMIVGIG